VHLSNPLVLTGIVVVLQMVAVLLVGFIDRRSPGGIGRLPFAILMSAPSAIAIASMMYMLRSDSESYLTSGFLLLALVGGFAWLFIGRSRWLWWWHIGGLTGLHRRVALEHPEVRRRAIVGSVVAAIIFVVIGYVTGGMTPWLALLAVLSAGTVVLEVWIRRPPGPDEHA